MSSQKIFQLVQFIFSKCQTFTIFKFSFKFQFLLIQRIFYKFFHQFSNIGSQIVTNLLNLNFNEIYLKIFA